jgi:tetratricopeptide (TPR) repeat protein
LYSQFLDVLHTCFGVRSVNFDDAFKDATALLKERKDEEALICYERALVHASSTEERQISWHMIGYTLCQLNRYDRSHHAYELSIALCESPVSEAMVRQDKASTLLNEFCQTRSDLRLLNKAKAELTTALTDLELIGERIEAAMCRSHIGRAFYCGRERSRARRMFLQAHEVLSNNEDVFYEPVYELENLLWLARTSTMSSFAYARKAYRLSKVLNKKEYWKRYLAILCGVDSISYT